jgi:hypothetical protein
MGILSCDRDSAELVSSGGFSAYPGMPPYEPVMSDEVGDGGDVNLSKLFAQAKAASNHTPLPDWEAEELAMALSRELTAPRELYNRIRRDLAKIRKQYAQEIPAVQITYQPQWLSGGIHMEIDSAVFFDSANEAYQLFGSLNGAFGLDYFVHRGFYYTYYELQLNGRYNPVRLIDQYYHIIGGGIELMRTPSLVGWDGPDMSVAMDGDVIRYYFRKAWGDCPSGCVFERVYFFSTLGGRLTYHGEYNNVDSPSPPKPDWYAVYWADVLSQRYGVSWYPDSIVYWP